jgi:hypothetical protein
MLKCKTPFMLIVGEEEEKTEPFLSVATDRKETSVTIEELLK